MTGSNGCAPQGVVDLVTMKGITWNGEELGASFDIGEIPDDMKEQAAEYREALMDAIVELDDDVMEAYLDVRALEPDLLPTVPSSSWR